MTATDKKILEMISLNARFSDEKIASMLGIEEKEVKDRIKAMEQSGLIVKYTTIINSELMDEDKVDALIEVKMTPKKGEGFDWLAKQIAAFNEVKGVYLMSGGYDLAVFIEGTSLKKVARFVSEHISAFDGVISTATHFILKKYKIEGNSTERITKDKRLSIHA